MYRRTSLPTAFLAATLSLAPFSPYLAAQQPLDPATQQLSHDIFKQLIEINTTDSVGSVTAAAQAMRQRRHPRCRLPGR